MNAYLHNLILIVITIGVLAVLNIIGAIYFNVGNNKQQFDGKKLFQGIVKAIIIVAIIAGLTYVWIVYTDLGVIEENLIDPYLICYVASLYYFSKVCGNLIKILGIDEVLKKKLG